MIPQLCLALLLFQQPPALNYEPKTPVDPSPIVVRAEPQVKDTPFVTLPATATISTPGRLLRIVPTTNCKILKWVVAPFNFQPDPNAPPLGPDDPGADLVPFPNGSEAIFSTPYKGKWMVMAWGASGDTPTEAGICWVTVGPVIPVPPTPIPIPPTPTPEPTDAWYQTIKATFITESVADKPKVKDMAAVWRAAADSIHNSGTTVAKDWFNANVVTPMLAKLGPTALLNTSKAVQQILNSNVTINREVAIDAPSQMALSTAFGRIADALDALGRLK